MLKIKAFRLVYGFNHKDIFFRKSDMAEYVRSERMISVVMGADGWCSPLQGQIDG